jgi:RHS repeat-associated protein
MVDRKRWLAVVVLDIFIAAQFPIVAIGMPAAVDAPRATPDGGRTADVIVRQDFLPDRGGTITLDGVELSIPPNALSHPTTISITRLAATQPLAGEMANVTAGGAGYRFEPHGLVFQRPVRVTIPFDRALLSSETGLSNLRTYFYNDLTGAWERLSRCSVDRDLATLTSTTFHFTDMVNATLTLPQGPAMAQFDPTTIKNLEAANPAAGIPQPEGLEPGPFGAASFSLALRLPPGRGTATPQLALRYSSDCANGWMGKGFDIEVPAITIDTRFGLPDYDGQDTYVLAGEELVPWGTDGAARRFRPMADKGFERIRWYRGGTEDYWEVTEKNGDVREYGRGEAWIGPTRSDHSRTFAWYLSSMRDTFGNTVSYTYAHDAANSATYLSEISYAGVYRIRFLLQDREDRRIDARGRFASTLAKRLSRVEILFDGTLFRAYDFTYATSESGQSLLSTYAEKNAAGQAMYSYAFIYYALPEHKDSNGTVIGYDAFGEAEQQWAAGSTPQFAGLQRSVNGSAGGSLYTGVTFSLWFPWIGDINIGSVGIRGGLDFSTGFTSSSFMDLNGDGLPDAVGVQGGTLVGYLNTGDGFSASTPFVVPGMSGRMDEESGNSFSVGLSAELAPFSGGITYQWGGSSGSTGFTDVNGDGFIDVVNKGSAYYLANSGTSLTSTPWQFGTPIERTASTDPREDEYQRTYYLEQPLRKWKAYRGGTLSIGQEASLLTPMAIHDEGVSLYTYLGASASRLHLDGTTTSTEGTSAYPVAAGDQIYFRESTGLTETGKDVEWNVTISYTGITLFEDMARCGLFKPPATSDSGYPYADSRLSPIYARSGSGYARVAGWEALDAATLVPVYDALIEHGAFVPRQLSLARFEALLTSLGSVETVVTDPRKSDGSTITVHTTDVLISSYRYVPELGLFIWERGDADTWILQHLTEAFTTVEELRDIASYHFTDGTLVIPRTEGTGYYHEAASTASSLAARIWSSVDGAPVGALVADKGTLLDATWPASGTTPVERFWLRGDASTGWTLHKEDVSTGNEVSVALVSATVKDGVLSASFSDRGVTRRSALSVPSAEVQSLPDALYEGAVTDRVLKDEAFSAYGVSRIPPASWTTIMTKLTSEEATLFGSRYTLKDGAYTLKASVSEADLVIILKALDACSDRLDSRLDRFPDDPQKANRIVLLTEEEHAALTTAAAGIDASFATFTEGSSAYYYQRTDLDDTSIQALHSALKRYRADVELFPYYEHDAANELHILKAGLGADDLQKVRAIMTDCGLSLWTSSQRFLRYSSTAALPVSPGTLPSDAVEESFFPGSASAATEGQATGVVTLPLFDAEGRTIFAERYVHVFNSAHDYSAMNLVENPDTKSKYMASEQLSGGFHGWFYGAWVAYYPWDEALFTAKPQVPVSGQVAPPPYFISMAPNRDSKGTLQIAADGRNPATPVAVDAWVGPVSSYSMPTLDDTGATRNTTYSFAATIHSDTLHPRRNGGDAYYRIPRDGGSASSGSLAEFRASSHGSTDVSGGVGIAGLGVNVGTNFGESWQYVGLMDLNGDRYPDLITYKPDQGGSGSFWVMPGTGGGFGNEISFSSPISHLAVYENSTLSFGASASSTNGGVSTVYDADGGPVFTFVETPDESFGGGVNATISSSYQKEGFFDVNGDGLPDHLQRSGSGGYQVALNTGTSAFAPAVGWGSGIAVPMFSTISLLATTSSGLDHTSNGSFGGSVNLGVSFGVIGGGITAGFTGTVNQTWSSLEDMNGDGLLDAVVKLPTEPYFRVRFNLGDRFSDEEVHLYRPDWGFSSSGALLSAINADLATIASQLTGVSLPDGLSTPASTGIPTLPNPFGAGCDPLSISDTMSFSSGVSFSLGATLTVSLRIPLVSFTITAGANGSIATTGVTLRMMDIDGDGLPDHVAKLPGEQFLRVKLNAGGRSGLLKSIALPQGGTCTLEYGRAGNTVAMPQNRWVLSRVTRDDGLAYRAPDRGEHSYSESFSYSGGYYSRDRREFWGFSDVVRLKADGSEIKVSYLTNDHYTRGMEWKRQTIGSPPGGGASVAWAETTLRVQERAYEGTAVVFPCVTAQTDRLYQPETGQYTETKKTFAYDDYGNLDTLVDEGDTATSGDELYAHVTYADLSGYLKQHPESIQVTDNGGSLLRSRRGSYGSRGELRTLTQYPSTSSSSTWELTWDDYGNLTSITDPRGSSMSWEYDTVVRRYAVATRSGNTWTGTAGYESLAEWDYRWGRETMRQDITGERMHYSYDGFGRILSVWSPYDTGDLPAVAYSYNTTSFPWTALTWNKVSFDPSDGQTLETAITVDGLGRAAQTAKQGEVWESGARRTGWNLSGAVVYDSRGRTVAEGQPQFSEGEALPALASLLRPTRSSYDILDRVIRMELPDGAASVNTFMVRGGKQVERSTDPKGNIAEKTLDARSNIVAVQRLNGGEQVLSSATYLYDIMGQILRVTDSAGNAVKSTYDLMGRRVRLESPDMGLVEYTYDESGNMTRKVDAVRRGRGEAVQYSYDGLNRLVKVDHPRSADITYAYGAAGAANHGAGKIVGRDDESGTMVWRYGKLGEAVGIDRTITRVTPMANAESASFSYVYDYLGRMQSITYPDGEVLSYGYDAGGQVKSAQGVHYGRTTTYVADIGYDQFGQRVYMKYGNGVETKYAYDENRRWLDSIHTSDGTSRTIQEMSYSFDAVGNIMGVSNHALSYQLDAGYTYDSLYQLTRFDGTIGAQSSGMSSYTSTCTQQFSFDAIGNMTGKQSTLQTVPQKSVGAALDYALDYAYYSGKPHQAERIGSLWYRYDANGNEIEERQGGHSSASSTDAELTSEGDLRVVNRGFGLTRRDDTTNDVYMRSLIWDEENRLKRSVESKESVDYRYGADGNRAVKYSGSGETLYFDAMWQATTDYPSLRQSKHIYVGETRIATRCNIEGEMDVGYEELNTYYYHGDHLGSAQMVTDAAGEVYEHMEYTPYGELWVEAKSDTTGKIPFRFTGKELDEETGLYYYGARYMDPKTCRWISGDPALGEYLPEAPTSDEARKKNGNLPGMGGVFNTVNLTSYQYAGNNPMKYMDPTGKLLIFTVDRQNQTMTVTFKEGAASTTYSVDITTAVVSGDRQAKQKMDTSRLQKTGDTQTHPTQMPTGTHSITGLSKTSDKTFGENWLTTDASQLLMGENGELVSDSGYFIHFTPYTNTSGCVGVKTKEEMARLEQAFRDNALSSDNRALLVVKGEQKK